MTGPGPFTFRHARGRRRGGQRGRAVGHAWPAFALTALLFALTVGVSLAVSAPAHADGAVPLQDLAGGGGVPAGRVAAAGLVTAGVAVALVGLLNWGSLFKFVASSPGGGPG